MAESLRDRISGAERAAVEEESPIAAIFRAAKEKAERGGFGSSQPPGGEPTPRASPHLRELPVDALDEMDQPFRMYSDEKMAQLRQSVIEHGIIQRLIVRPSPDKPGRWQIVSGRNRRRAAALAGYVMVPCEIRDLDDDEARLQMVETNLRQREELLPSEKAKAYRIRLEALAHQGKTTLSQSATRVSEDLWENNPKAIDPLGDNGKRTCGQIGHKSREDIADDESGRQVQRYIRLTYLEKPLLDAVDSGELGLGVGVTLSYLSPESQGAVWRYFFMDHRQKITGDMAGKLRAADEEATLTPQLIADILSPAGKPSRPLKKVSIGLKPLRRFFEPDLSPKEVEKEIVKIVTEHFAEKPPAASAPEIKWESRGVTPPVGEVIITYYLTNAGPVYRAAVWDGKRFVDPANHSKELTGLQFIRWFQPPKQDF